MTTNALGEGTAMAVRVSRVVQILRTLAGESQTDIARALDVPQSAVSARLRGQTKWTVDDLEVLANHYGKPITVFFSDPGEFLPAPELSERRRRPGRLETYSCTSRGMRTRLHRNVIQPTTAA